MQREQRARTVQLEAILDKAAAAEKRFLADLRNAGWDFGSLEEARDHRRSIRHLNQMSQADLLALVARDRRRVARERTTGRKAS
jgi:hypothetical protein